MVVSTKEHYSGDRSNDDLELPLFDVNSVSAATNNFSDENKLGQGGFGCVYKVKLMLEITRILIESANSHKEVT